MRLTFYSLIYWVLLWEYRCLREQQTTNMRQRDWVIGKLADASRPKQMHLFR